MSVHFHLVDKPICGLYDLVAADRDQTMAYTKEYWEQNGDRIAERRRERYQNDPEYRANVLARSSEYREKQRAEREAFLANPIIYLHGKTVAALTVDQLCDAVGITKGRLKYLQRTGYIPAALTLRPVRLYTNNQANLITEMETFLQDNSKFLRATRSEEGQAAQAGLEKLTTYIAQNWEK